MLLFLIAHHKKLNKIFNDLSITVFLVPNVALSILVTVHISRVAIKSLIERQL